MMSIVNMLKKPLVILSVLGAAHLSASDFSYSYFDLAVGDKEYEDSDETYDYTSFSGGGAAFWKYVR